MRGRTRLSCQAPGSSCALIGFVGTTADVAGAIEAPQQPSIKGKVVSYDRYDDIVLIIIRTTEGELMPLVLNPNADGPFIDDLKDAYLDDIEPVTVDYVPAQGASGYDKVKHVGYPSKP